MKDTVENGKYTRCTNKKNTVLKNDQKGKIQKKVIHIKNNGKMEKKELYTKLCTLST